jgi:FMN phosphatase YigB (HAD superfamily)
MGIAVDLLASSARWGVHKPSPAFFARLAAELGLEPDEVAYVGDRVDNDVAPAAGAGMLPVFLRRGPWAFIQAGRTILPPTTVTIASLDELPAAFARPDAQPVQETAR